MVQQDGRLREREVLFEGEANQIQRSIESAIDDAATDFQTSMNFIAATHPGPVQEYQDFFGNQPGVEGELPDTDPGVLFVEEIEVTAFAELTAREHELGNADFRVLSLPGPSETRLIITRTARDLNVFGLAINGLDVTSANADLAHRERDRRCCHRLSDVDELHCGDPSRSGAGVSRLFR